MPEIIVELLLSFLWFGLMLAVCGGLVYLWNFLTGETRRREEQRKLDEEKRREDEQKRRSAEQKRRKHQQEAEEKRREEQAAFEREHSHVINNMKELVSSCRQPLEDALRGAAVLTGDSLVKADEALMMDIWEISKRLELADGSNFPDAPRRLRKALCCVVEPRLNAAPNWESLMSTLYPTHAAQDVASKLGVPRVVSILVLYDTHAGTQLASKAAATCRSVLLSMSALHKGSIVLKMVIDEYLTVLKPYIEDGDAGSAGASSKRSTGRGGCDQCAHGYRLLNLSYGASEEEVESQRIAMSLLFHPDRLGTMSEKVRHAGEGQLKSINEACSHILQCSASGSSR